MECLWSCCHLPKHSGFIGSFREAKMCSGFPPPQAARVTVAAGNKGLWVVLITVTW